MKRSVLVVLTAIALFSMAGVVAVAAADPVLAQCFDAHGGLTNPPATVTLDRSDPEFPRKAQAFQDECARRGGTAKFSLMNGAATAFGRGQSAASRPGGAQMAQPPPSQDAAPLPRKAQDTPGASHSVTVTVQPQDGGWICGTPFLPDRPEKRRISHDFRRVFQRLIDFGSGVFEEVTIVDLDRNRDGVYEVRMVYVEGFSGPAIVFFDSDGDMRYDEMWDFREGLHWRDLDRDGEPDPDEFELDPIWASLPPGLCI